MNNEDKQLKHYINVLDALTLLLTDLNRIFLCFKN